MRGDLSRTSAADACRDLARQAATGLLAIEGPDGPGSVSMVEGRIVAASSPTPRARLGDRLVGASYLDEQDLADALRIQRTGEDHARLGVLLVERGLVSRDAVRLFIQEQMLDALFDILRWRYGSFEFIRGEATEVLEVPLSIAVDEILVEVARRQQEWEQVHQVIPDLEAVPTFRDGASSAAAALEPDEFAVLASVDGERSVRALASDLGYGEFEAARIVYGLCLLGIVEIQLPEDEVGAALDDAFSAPADAVADTDAVPDADGASDADEDVAVDQPAPAVVDQPAGDADMAVELDSDLSDLIAELTGARDDEPPAAATPITADTADDAPDGTHEPEPFSAMIDGMGSAGPAADLTGEGGTPGPPLDAPTDDTAEPEPLPQRTPGAGLPPQERVGDDAGPDLPPPGADEPPAEREPAAAAEVDHAGHVPPVDEPAAHDQPADAEHADTADQPPTTEEPPEQPPEQPPPASSDDEAEDAPASPPAGGDVSEFLRELSRLALDGEEAPKPRPGGSSSPSPRSPKPQREDDKPKKRGLFGWGG